MIALLRDLGRTFKGGKIYMSTIFNGVLSAISQTFSIHRVLILETSYGRSQFFLGVCVVKGSAADATDAPQP
jgi:hypothetical protein